LDKIVGHRKILTDGRLTMRILGVNGLNTNRIVIKVALLKHCNSHRLEFSASRRPVASRHRTRRSSGLALFWPSDGADQ